MEGEEEIYNKYESRNFGSRDQKIEVSKKYIKDMGRSRGRPEDPFAVSKFVEENDLLLKRREVERLLAIDSLPLDIKRGLDEKYIDTLTAYELTKFSRDEQLNLYHYFRSFRKIPRDVRIKALKKYMDNRGQPFSSLFIGEYRNYISNKYPIFNRLSDAHIINIAQNIEPNSLGKLSENLEYMINEYKNIKKRLRNTKKDITTYRASLEEAIEKGDAEKIKYYSEQLRKSIIEHNDLSENIGIDLDLSSFILHPPMVEAANRI